MLRPAAPFRVGQDIAWRVRIRAESGVDDVALVLAMRVIQDTPEELILLRRPGDAVRRRSAERRGPKTHRHQLVVAWGDAWQEAAWLEHRVLVIKRPADEYAISLFWRDGSEELRCWYIDLMSGLTRNSAGFEIVENGLDIVAEPDLRSWTWKDEDELDYAVEVGVYTRVEADALYATGRQALERLMAEREAFEPWRGWRPDPSWPPAALPPGWDRSSS